MAYEKLVSTNYKWKVLKRKKPPKWWLISSYKNVLQVLSGGLFAHAEMREDIAKDFIRGDGIARDFGKMKEDLA